MPAPRSFRHLSVVPDLPPPSAYLPLLERAHAASWFTNFGPIVRAFEDDVLDALGVPGECCVSAANATAGLSAALLAARVAGPVLVPAFTFPASLGAVRAAGLQAIVVDVEPDTWALGAERLRSALDGTGADAVMLVAPFGLERDVSEAFRLCRDRGATVVIDNAAGFGTPRRAAERHPGAFEVFSLHATKPLGIGEGGLVFGPRSHEAALRSALNFGKSESTPLGYEGWGFNGKMSELQAAVGVAQFARRKDILARRQAFASLYVEALAGLPLVHPTDPASSPWQFFPVLLPDAATAERFVAAAADGGVEIRRYYRPSLSRLVEADGATPCPVAEDLADRMCVLPVRSQTSADLSRDIVRTTTAILARSLP
ncbi:DegT/DnrJ/EryC1/StrS family aminotransferase [Prosthecomicrobium sp. N25]|uniref:DegT/DnrJ/EryC1/StrS family aminotransferase n=1 Tax=Prosthecomicrobium sp. N25 TaxID=3129254 RepID=UPI003077F704